LEISQGNSPCSYLYPKQAKISVFFFFLLGNQRIRGPAGSVGEGGRVGTSGRGRWRGRGVRERMQCKNCVHMFVNAKMIPVETTPGMEEKD
jgi:hypothetical protein